MSDWPDRSGQDQIPMPRSVRGLLTRKVTRFLVCTGLAVGLAAVSPMGGLTVAGAATVPAGHHSTASHSKASRSKASHSKASHSDAGKAGIKGDHARGGRGGGVGGGFGGGKSANRGHHQRNVIVDGIVLSGGAGADFTLTATSATVKSLRGTSVTVDVTSSTTYGQPGVKSPSVAVGDFVIVKGSDTAANSTITARSVEIPAVEVTGDVTSGGAGSAFTLTTTSTTIYGAKGTTVTIDVNAGGATTRYREKGTSSPTVAVGDKVQVIGSQAGTATVDAALVVITAPPPNKHHHRPVPVAYGRGGNRSGHGGRGFGGGRSQGGGDSSGHGGQGGGSWGGHGGAGRGGGRGGRGGR